MPCRAILQPLLPHFGVIGVLVFLDDDCLGVESVLVLLHAL